MNKAILIGHLGKDAETRAVNDKSVITFNIATSETWRDRNNDKQTETQWHRVEYWAKSAGIAGYLGKGAQVAVEGQIKTDEYKDKDGQNQRKRYIRAHKIELIKGVECNGQSGRKPQQYEGYGAPAPGPGDDPDEVIPF